MRYHIQPRLKYCQPDAGDNGPDINTLDGRRITRIQENGQDPEDVEDEWNVMETVRTHLLPWTGMTFFPISQLGDIGTSNISGTDSVTVDKQESVAKRQRIGPSLGETMWSRLVEKLRQARVQRAGPYAGGKARARSILTGAQDMFRTTNPNVAMMEEVPHDKRTFDESEEPGNIDQDAEVQPKRIKSEHRQPVKTDQDQGETKISGNLPTRLKREVEAQMDAASKEEAKRQKTTVEPWPDDYYAFLTGEDIPDVTPEADLIGGEELPPEARKCPEAVRKMIRVAHRNLGHPSNHALVRVMKIAKCHPDMLAYARSMRCPTCIRRKPPQRIPRTTMPYRPTRFNALVGLDLKWIHDSTNTSYLV